MYTSTILSLLLASTTLAAPNPIDILAPPKRDIAILATPAQFDDASLSTITLTVTIFGTVTSTAAPTTVPSVSASLPTSTAVSAPDLVEELAGVYICSDVNWSGTCEHKRTPIGSSDSACTQLDGRASSIGPDMGFYCLFFTNAYCRPLASDGSDTLSLEYPGASNLLVTEKGNLNDKIYSYQCFRDEVSGE